MNKLMVITLVFSLFIVGCKPSSAAIEEAIQLTQLAQPTNTPVPPTPTPEPTKAYCDYAEVMQAREDLLPILESFIDLYSRGTEVANQTQFLPLITEIEDLQKQLDEIVYPPCFSNAFVYLKASFDSTYEAFKTGYDGDFSTSIEKIQQAGEAIIESNKEIQKITDCLPNCQP